MLTDYFEKGQSLEIEIGCGKGKFLVGRAAAHPEIRFIGIDKAGKWMRRGKKRSEKRELTNIQFIRGDVREFLEHAVGPESVSVFHIYFPDPWPKRRHRPRRLFDTDFLEMLYGRLKRGGLVEVATDFEDYFVEMKKKIQETLLPWEGVRESVNQRLFEVIDKTHYEIKYENQGKDLYYLELKK